MLSSIFISLTGIIFLCNAENIYFNKKYKTLKLNIQDSFLFGYNIIDIVPTLNRLLVSAPRAIHKSGSRTGLVYSCSFDSDSCEVLPDNFERHPSLYQDSQYSRAITNFGLGNYAVCVLWKPHNRKTCELHSYGINRDLFEKGYWFDSISSFDDNGFSDLQFWGEENILIMAGSYFMNTLTDYTPITLAKFDLDENNNLKLVKFAKICISYGKKYCTRPSPRFAYGYIIGNKTSFAFTTPDTLDMKGKLVIYTYDFVSENPTLELELTGEDWIKNSNFGNDILALDLNGDGFDDLLVASSHESYKTIEFRGVVRLFTNIGKPPYINPSSILIYGPEVANSYFGFRLTAAKDLNNDGLPDFFVTCLKDENGLGAIYVYYGSKDKEKNYHSFVEKIIEEPNPNINLITGFGFKIFTERDFNNDGYNDLAITNIFNDSIDIYLRRKPVDKKIGISHSPEDSIYIEYKNSEYCETEHFIKICDQESEEQNIKIKAKITINGKGLAYFDPISKNLTYTQNPLFSYPTECVTIPYFFKPIKGKIMKEIIFDIEFNDATYELNFLDCKSTSCPIYLSVSRRLQIPIKRRCSRAYCSNNFNLSIVDIPSYLVYNLERKFNLNIIITSRSEYLTPFEVLFYHHSFCKLDSCDYPEIEIIRHANQNYTSLKLYRLFLHNTFIQLSITLLCKNSDTRIVSSTFRAFLQEFIYNGIELATESEPLYFEHQYSVKVESAHSYERILAKNVVDEEFHFTFTFNAKGLSVPDKFKLLFESNNEIMGSNHMPNVKFSVVNTSFEIIPITWRMCDRNCIDRIIVLNGYIPNNYITISVSYTVKARLMGIYILKAKLSTLSLSVTEKLNDTSHHYKTISVRLIPPSGQQLTHMMFIVSVTIGSSFVLLTIFFVIVIKFKIHRYLFPDVKIQIQKAQEIPNQTQDAPKNE